MICDIKYCSWLNRFTFIADFYLKDEEKVCWDIKSRAESTINKVMPNPLGTYGEFVMSPILKCFSFLAAALYFKYKKINIFTGSSHILFLNIAVASM